MPPVRLNPTMQDVEALTGRAADALLKYGDGEFQFGALHLPTGDGPHPVAVLLHGGCWLAKRSLDYILPMAAALADQGYAVWTPEYRRIGNPGGGWPGTFLDAGAAADHVRELANSYPLDLGRVVALGHSAGGHLALWLAGRPFIQESSPLWRAGSLPLAGVISLGGITDLADYHEVGNDCSKSVALLMGGLPVDLPDRYAAGNPAALLPSFTPTRLIHGSLDAIVPMAQPVGYARAACAANDDNRLVVITGGGHFDVVSPEADGFAEVAVALKELARV